MGDPGGASEQLDTVFLEFFKALAVPERLRVAGAIVAKRQIATDLARELDLPLRAVAGHLSVLTNAGFVRQDGEGHAATYVWDEGRVRALAADHLDSPRVRALAGATDERSRVLAALVRDGRLVRFPTGEKRKQIILDFIAERFDADRTYTEKEVNAILREFADDYTTIRRALVDRLYLNRHQGVYWLGRARQEPGGAGGPESTGIP
jgi:ArsR family transcriptional regulator